MSIAFQAWPKTPRLFRDIVVTEKIDGTNSAIIIQQSTDEFQDDPGTVLKYMWDDDGFRYMIGAQSRNRLITPGKTTDNYGFAGWVQENADQLFGLLGPGRHYGEWWGKGIARNYGMDFRVFSLFNTDRYDGLAAEVGDHVVDTVPVLYHGEFSESVIKGALTDLHWGGSEAAPGFANPEGICVYHTQSKQVYKVTLDGNDKGKWETDGR